ncbi:MAG: hypothetical protein ISS18_11705 [Bacteroidales bacterium]|nr:hypothetical protein [Bacteroidales bacterium]
MNFVHLALAINNNIYAFYNMDSVLVQIQRTIDHEEKKIDELVYELYGLSEEEIKIVEEN